jgi:hypothetical protein
MFSGIRKILSTIFLGVIFLLIPKNNLHAQTGQGENDLSFVVNSNQIFYGINAGSNNKELRFRYKQQNKQNVLYFDIYEENQFFTFGAYNSSGVFILIQDHPGSNSQNHLTPDDFDNQFGKLLFDSSSVYDLEFENIDGNTILVPESNLLISDASGNLVVLHTFKDTVELIQSNLPYYGATYWYPYIEFQPDSSLNIEATNHSNLMDAIDKLDENFSIESGFEVLTQFYPEDDRLTSIMISPNNNQVYVSLDSDAEEIWRFDINGGTVETHLGFEQNHKANIPKLGITTSDLVILNFSNEDLTVGIISIAIGILLIIIISTIIILPKLEK